MFENIPSLAESLEMKLQEYDNTGENNELFEQRHLEMMRQYNEFVQETVNYCRTGRKTEGVDYLSKHRPDIVKNFELLQQRGFCPFISTLEKEDTDKRIPPLDKHEFSFELYRKKFISELVQHSYMDTLLTIISKEDSYLSEANSFAAIKENTTVCFLIKTIGTKYMKEDDLRNAMTKENMDESRILKVISGNMEYFNVSPKKESYVVSLTGKGSRFYNFLNRDDEKISSEQLSKILYSNICKVLDMLLSSEEDFRGNLTRYLDGNVYLRQSEKRALRNKLMHIQSNFMNREECIVVENLQLELKQWNKYYRVSDENDEERSAYVVKY